MVHDSLFSSSRMDWETPDHLFKQLDQEFGFNLDVCATSKNAKCARYYSPEQDGLKNEWGGICWMNPPYGRAVGDWIKKAYEESLKGAVVVCLIPARTDTKYWHDYVMQAHEIRFVKGRVKFSLPAQFWCKTLPDGRELWRYYVASNSAPFPSAIVIFDGRRPLCNNCAFWGSCQDVFSSCPIGSELPRLSSYMQEACL
ncbi:phage N-6-adenine-methyltransferase [Methanohalophilus levihalophilus]|uniref:DNA N-6-adenine-methyltransferase n=1 Tax=Methanohalophilus levihalophilus TaxID=1431282 RepID=UPI001AE2F9CF|nr:DNA N-6-adenine-methyltransferase [Methanohalophilus levihalophilus]MBP2029356.1 phage N-6-adenine-methyltransferase [Methanohalophilus levihalophilus]